MRVTLLWSHTVSNTMWLTVYSQACTNIKLTSCSPGANATRITHHYVNSANVNAPIVLHILTENKYEVVIFEYKCIITPNSFIRSQQHNNTNLHSVHSAKRHIVQFIERRKSAAHHHRHWFIAYFGRRRMGDGRETWAWIELNSTIYLLRIYTYLSIYTYVSVYLCMCLCIYVFMDLCVYVYPCMYVCMYVCMYDVCMYVCMYVCM